MRLAMGSVLVARAGLRLWADPPLNITVTSAILLGSGILLILGDGYPLDSGSPYRLWFAFSFPGGRVDDPVISDGIDSHRLLREAKEELASTF